MRPPSPRLLIAPPLPAAILAQQRLAHPFLALSCFPITKQELAANNDVEYIAGGAGQNSTRVCQWLMQYPRATSYMGCIGNDEFGRKMAEAATQDGVNVSVGEVKGVKGVGAHVLVPPHTWAASATTSLAGRWLRLRPRMV